MSSADRSACGDVRLKVTTSPPARSANAALSSWLGRDAILVYFDGDARRTASREWAGEETPVTFADGFQILITNTASLAGSASLAFSRKPSAWSTP